VAFRARRQDERIVVTLPLVRDSLAIGSLEAEVRLSGVLPTDSMPVLIGGARLSVTDSGGANAFVYPGLTDVFPGASRFTLDNEEWLVARRRLKDPPIVLHLAAPITSFVAPYESAARIGLLVFALVVVLAIVLSSYLTRRITRPIEQLAYAADAVSGGNLDATVEVTGPGEIGTLSQSFASMLGSLRSTLQELSERRALATIGELSATLAHEVRNGLSSVRVDLQRLEETRGDGIEGNLARRALHNVERLNSTVTSTLAVARGGRVAARPVALNDVLAAAAIGAGPSFTAARAQLALRSARTESLLVVGDGAALEHLFLNLLINAAQAMPDGGTATVEVESLERSARVSVRDTGMGIDPGQLAKLSRPFSSTRNGGTGLGLAISRKIAEAHGGSIDFDSAPGLGTTVHVTLPLAAQ
jgi:signal transduction histidine kinase